MATAIANSSLLGQYEQAQSTQKKSTTDKDTFLTLLITQLTHQDPLNPVEDTEFLAQLAQFNSVEQLQNLNSTVENMSGVVAQSQITDAVGLIGRAVQAKGDYVRFIPDTTGEGKDYCTTLYAELPRAASEVYINVYATDSDGNIGSLVYSTTAGAQNAGELPVIWNGHSNDGTKLPGGTYIMNVTAVDKNGNNMLVETNSDGIVIGVKTETDGNHKLYLDDGRTVDYHSVTTITYVPQTQEETTPEEETSPEGGNTGGTGDETTEGNTTGGTTTGGETTGTGSNTPEDGSTTPATPVDGTTQA